MMTGLLDVVDPVVKHLPLDGQQAFCLLLQLSKPIRSCIQQQPVLHVRGVPSKQWLLANAHSMASLVYGRSATYIQQAEDEPVAIKRGAEGSILRDLIAALSAAVHQREVKLPLQSFEYRPPRYLLHERFDVVAAGQKLGEIVQPGKLTELHFVNSRAGVQLGWGLGSLQHLSGLRGLTSLALDGRWDGDAADVVLPPNLSQLVLSCKPGKAELLMVCIQKLSSLVDLHLIYGVSWDDFDSNIRGWDHDPPSAVTQLSSNSSLTRLLLEEHSTWTVDELRKLCTDVKCLRALRINCDEQLPRHFGPVLCQAVNLTSFSLGLE